MTDLRTAAQQALEALMDYKRSDDDRVSIAMGILQDALAQEQAEPAQEPVRNGDTLPDRVVLNNWAADRLARHGIPMPGDDLC